MQSMRAKARINHIAKNDENNPTQETLSFVFPAKNGTYPEDGSDEDQQFARYSPSASLTITVANPNLIGKFKVGDTFYLNFEPIEAE